MLELLIEETRKSSVRSLYDDRLSIFPDEIAAGDTFPLSVGVVDRIGSPWSSRKFTPQDLTSVTFRAALGLGFLAPVAGSIPFTFTAADSSTQTTPALAFNFTDNDLSAALNALSKVTAVGGVTVLQPSISDAFYVVTFNSVGVRNLLIGNIGGLVPLSICDVQRAVTGDSQTQEVQTIRIVQNAGAINTLSTAAANAGITLTQPQVGSGSANAQWRVALTGGIYKGSWTLSKTTGITGTSAAILFDDTGAQIRAKLEATTGIGVGNVSVSQEDEKTWLIEFIGSLAATAITVTVNGGNLVAIQELTGTLDLRTPGIAMLLNGSESQVVTLEIEKTVGAGAPTKILRRDVLLVKPTIEPAMSTPSPSPTILSLFGSSPNVSIAATGTTDLAPPTKFAQWMTRLIFGAGSVAYTAKITLDNANPIVGAVFRVPVEITQSANPTINFYDSTIGGTLLKTLAGDSSNAQYATLVFIFQDDLHWHYSGVEA